MTKTADMRVRLYDITPVPKPRQTQSDKWKQRPSVMRYRAFATKCRLQNVKVWSCNTVIFWMPMPKSWSKKKKEENVGMPHRQTPDLDNLLKALLDAVYEDDSEIWAINAQKQWSVEGWIEVRE